MKRKNMLVAVLLAFCLVFAAIPVLAMDYGCFPTIPLGGSADVKYYQDQSADVAVGVTNSCYSEKAVFHSDKEVCAIDATAFGAVDKVGCTGVLGVGQINATASKTNTSTCGSYDLHQVSTTLSNVAQMNQLGGIAATATGAANSGGVISQTQTLTSGAVAALPGGFATTSYKGTQTAIINASAH